MKHPVVVAVFLLAGLLAGAGSAATQDATQWNPQGLQLSREALQELLARYEQTAASKAYSATLRDRARYEASLISARLAEGDFQVGDRVEVVVEGEPQLSDTLVVAPGKVLVMPVIGSVSLEGLLRSELEGHLVETLRRYIRQPVVHARSLIRIAVMGSVGAPGYYVVPSESLVTDVLMMAGGPARDADLAQMYVERGATRIWAGEPLQQSITEGRTLDQLSFRAGDRVTIPEVRKGEGSVMRVLQATGMVAGLILGLSRFF